MGSPKMTTNLTFTTDPHLLKLDSHGGLHTEDANYEKRKHKPHEDHVYSLLIASPNSTPFIIGVSCCYYPFISLSINRWPHTR